MVALLEMRAEINIEGLEEMSERLKRLEEVIAVLAKPPEKNWFDVNAAAKYLGISAKSVRRLIQRRLLKRSLGVRHIRIHRTDLEDYRRKTTI